MSNQIMIINADNAIENAQNRKRIVSTLRQTTLVEGVDFGVVPGTQKPTLLKPGAERLCSALGFAPVFEVSSKVENWSDDCAFFHYEVTCKLIHIDSGLIIATGIGSCNSKENRYRWRWVNRDDVPLWLDIPTLKTRNSEIVEFDFAVEKAETTGKYGKPAEYWQAFKTALENGTARRIKKKDAKQVERDAIAIGDTQYRIPNDEIFTLVNTFQKMACKRALIAAILIGANASEFFTQDVEDMADVIDATYSVVSGNGKPTESSKWYENPQQVNELIDRAVQSLGAKRDDLMKIDWSQYPTRQAAGDVIKAMYDFGPPPTPVEDVPF
jgi:hypothetical protein